MSKGLLFWMLFILTVIFSVWGGWPEGGRIDAHWFGAFGGNLLEFILIGLLGWQVFGAAVQ